MEVKEENMSISSCADTYKIWWHNYGS